jgi:hypothetical protein
LQDGSGAILATGTPATNLTSVVQNFVAPATGTYYARVFGTGNSAYSLVVTKGAAFDTRSNGTLATAQTVTGTQGGLESIVPGAVVPNVVVPSSAANTETSGGTAIPFSLSPSSLPSMRYQQIYAASEFGAGGIINAIRFRRYYGQGPFTSTVMNISISLGYAATTVATASPAFANNIGPGGSVNVYSGSLVLSSTAAGSTPQAFDVVINLMHNFKYNPAQGNLLLDISLFNAPGSGFYLAATPPGTQTTTTSIVAADVNAPLGTVGYSSASPGPYGLVTRFDFVPPSQPEWYKVTLSGNQTALQVETSTPLAGPNQPLNGLSPQIQLFNSAGTLIANGSLLADGRNQSLLATGLTAGSAYYIEITSANSTTGEYFLGVTPLGTLTPNSLTKRVPKRITS